MNCPQCTSARRDVRYMLTVAVPSGVPDSRGNQPRTTRGVGCTHPWHDERPHDCAYDGHDIEHLISADGNIVGLLCTACGSRWRTERIQEKS